MAKPKLKAHVILECLSAKDFAPRTRIGFAALCNYAFHELPWVHHLGSALEVASVLSFRNNRQ